MIHATHRGRFAPTPSGPLHLGSLITALAGWLDARHHGGGWLLRIDDLDAPRCRPGHVDTILRQLEAHGLTWDEVPRLQSDHVEAYRAALQALRVRNLLYACHCTRAQLAEESLPGIDGPVYGGRCRDRQLDAHPHRALRLRLGAEKPRVIVEWSGPVERLRRRDTGDFVVLRADGQPGYQLASVVDDIAMGITDAVRGADLLGSSFRQIELFDILQQPPPRFRHVPLLTTPDGRKLSKQNHAPPLDGRCVTASLRRCLRWLGQAEPEGDTAEAILKHAARTWDPGRVPAAATVVMDVPAP